MSGDTVPIEAAAVWPDDAEDVTEGVVANWFVREGGHVEEGETVCEIQVEKVSVDVPAPASGRVAEIRVRTNGQFSRGDALGRIEPD